MAKDGQPPRRPGFRIVNRLNGSPSGIGAAEYFLHTAAKFDPPDEAIANYQFEWACYGLLPAASTTMICAPANLGKSSVAFHLLQEAATQRSMEAFYFHADAGPGDAATFAKSARAIPDVFYLMPDFGGTPSVDVMRNALADIFAITQEQELPDNYLQNYVICLDSLGNFIDDVNSKVEVKMFFRDLKRLRGLGATILILHHPTKRKDGDEFVFDGVNNIKTEVDHLIYLDHDGERGKWRDIAVRVDKTRASFDDRFIERLSLDKSNRTIALAGRQIASEDHRLLDWLAAELQTVTFLTRPQAVELLRQKGCGRNEARRLIELGLLTQRWGQESGGKTGRERRLFRIGIF